MGREELAANLFGSRRRKDGFAGNTLSARMLLFRRIIALVARFETRSSDWGPLCPKIFLRRKLFVGSLNDSVAPGRKSRDISKRTRIACSKVSFLRVTSPKSGSPHGMRNDPRSVDPFSSMLHGLHCAPAAYKIFFHHLRQILWQMLHCLTSFFLCRLLKWRRSEAPDRICYDTDGSADEWDTRFAEG